MQRLPNGRRKGVRARRRRRVSSSRRLSMPPAGCRALSLSLEPLRKLVSPRTPMVCWWRSRRLPSLCNRIWRTKQTNPRRPRARVQNRRRNHVPGRSAWAGPGRGLGASAGLARRQKGQAFPGILQWLGTRVKENPPPRRRASSRYSCLPFLICTAFLCTCSGWPLEWHSQLSVLRIKAE
jgi:hypothetical protein